VAIVEATISSAWRDEADERWRDCPAKLNHAIEKGQAERVPGSKAGPFLRTPEEHEEIGHWFKKTDPEIAVRHYQLAR
jgi:hypothetical protein